MTLWDEISRARAQARSSSPDGVCVRQWVDFPRGMEEFVIVLKPETFAAGVASEAIVDLVEERLGSVGVAVSAVRVMSGRGARECDYVAQHYPILDRHARTKKKRLAPTAPAGAATSVGAFDHLASAGGSAAELEELCESHGVVKSGAGIYYSRVNEQDRTLVINGFYPALRERYERPDAISAVLRCSSHADLGFVRDHVVGATSPRLSSPGTIKAALHRHADDYAVREVSVRYNFVHISPCAAEGVAHAHRYFEAEESPEGSLLFVYGLSRGLPEVALRELIRPRGHSESLPGAGAPVVELTEGLGAVATVNWLCERQEVVEWLARGGQSA